MFDLKRTERENALADAVVAEFVAVPTPPTREALAHAFGMACVKMNYAPDDAQATQRILDNVSVQIARLTIAAENLATAAKQFDHALTHYEEVTR